MEEWHRVQAELTKRGLRSRTSASQREELSIRLEDVCRDRIGQRDCSARNLGALVGKRPLARRVDWIGKDLGELGDRELAAGLPQPVLQRPDARVVGEFRVA